MGHYAITCSKKKNKGKGKNVAAVAEVKDFASQFEQEFSFVASLSMSLASSSLWFIDSGASSHMTGVREHFSQLAERRCKEAQS